MASAADRAAGRVSGAGAGAGRQAKRGRARPDRRRAAQHWSRRRKAERRRAMHHGSARAGRRQAGGARPSTGTAQRCAARGGAPAPAVRVAARRGGQGLSSGRAPTPHADLGASASQRGAARITAHVLPPRASSSSNCTSAAQAVSGGAVPAPGPPKAFFGPSQRRAGVVFEGAALVCVGRIKCFCRGVSGRAAAGTMGVYRAAAWARSSRACRPAAAGIPGPLRGRKA